MAGSPVSSWARSTSRCFETQFRRPQPRSARRCRPLLGERRESRADCPGKHDGGAAPSPVPTSSGSFRSAQAGTFAAASAFDGVQAYPQLPADRALAADRGCRRPRRRDLYRRWFYRTSVDRRADGGAHHHGRSSCCVLLRRDLHARQMAEKNLDVSEHQYRLLAESAADVICRVDRHTIRTYVSPSCARYGYEPDELIGLNSSSWVPPGRPRLHAGDLPADDRRNRWTAPFAIGCGPSPGQYTWVESHLSPLRQGGYLGIIRNIDAEMRGEQEQREADKDPGPQATADEMTGLANRRAFGEMLDAAWQEAAAGRRPALPRARRCRSLQILQRPSRPIDRRRGARRDSRSSSTAAARRFGGGPPARYRQNEFAVILPRGGSQRGTPGVARDPGPPSGMPACRMSAARRAGWTVSAGAADGGAETWSRGSSDALIRAASDALGRAQAGRPERGAGRGDGVSVWRPEGQGPCPGTPGPLTRTLRS